MVFTVIADNIAFHVPRLEEHRLEPGGGQTAWIHCDKGPVSSAIQ